jgi:hypothetical protein
METGRSAPKILPRDKSEASRSDEDPVSFDTAGSATHSNVVVHDGRARQLTYGVTATHQSFSGDDDALLLEQNTGGAIGQKPYADANLDLGPINELQQPPERLDHRLRVAMVKSEGKGSGEGFFVPSNDITLIVDTQSVFSELKELDLDDNQDLMGVAHQVCSEHDSKDASDGKTTKTTRQRIFAILVLMEETKSIFDVIREGLYDWNLPLSLVTKTPGHHYLARRIHDGSLVPVNFSRNWPHYKHGVFANSQWQLWSPCFELRTYTGDKINHYWLEPQSILPIIEMDGKEVHGGFSTISKIRLHAAHWNMLSRVRRHDLFFIHDLALTTT